MSQQHYIEANLRGESGRARFAAFHRERIQLHVKHRLATRGVRITDVLRWDLLNFGREIQWGLQSIATSEAKDVVRVAAGRWGVDYVLLNELDRLLGLSRHCRHSRSINIATPSTHHSGSAVASVPVRSGHQDNWAYISRLRAGPVESTVLGNVLVQCQAAGS